MDFRTFKKLPPWVAAIAASLVILEGGTLLWGILARTNLRVSPGFPWSGALMILFLIALLKYLNGWGAPQSTQHLRRLWLRANPIPQPMRGWAALSALLLAITLITFTFLSWKLIPFEFGPLSQIQRIVHYRWWTIATLILATSIVAGIIEEVAFRGFMQKPLEMKYGRTVAVGVVAAFFTMVHLPGLTITPALIPIFFIGSLGWGALACLTNSIIPGIIAHTAMDTIGYFWIWLNLQEAKELAESSVLVSGLDRPFIIGLGVLAFVIPVLFYSFTKLRKQGTLIIEAKSELHP